MKKYLSLVTAFILSASVSVQAQKTETVPSGLVEDTLPEQRQISCVTIGKIDTYDVIEQYGGVHSLTGAQWILDRDEAVEAAKSKMIRFFTRAKEVSAWVEVDIGSTGRVHLRTMPDSILENNLLQLPQCPKPKG